MRTDVQAHAHHIQHWAAGGHTSVKNLVTLCSYHDKLVHEGGFSLQRAADGQLVFRTPSGHPIALAPTSPGGSAGSLAIDNAQFGINVSAETGAALWDGACVDYEHVLFTFFAGGSQVGTRAAAG